MDNLYKLYVKERLDQEVIEMDHGFITYKINDNEVFIQDMFVRDGYRKQHFGKTLVDRVEEIARENNKKYVTATILPSAGGATVSLLGALSIGFKLIGADKNCVIIGKEV